MASWIDDQIRLRAKQLVKYGFVNDVAKKLGKYEGKSAEQIEKEFQGLKSDVSRQEKMLEFERDADMHWMEVQRDQLMGTPYPAPCSHYYMVYEQYHEAIEPIYFWCLNNLMYDWGFPVVHKITDIFSAAEHSSLYGASATRLGLAQDKVGQYLATIGRMTKDLFALVRELRIIDERMVHYKVIKEPSEARSDVERKKNEERRVEAEVVLKGMWVDLVDGVVQGQRTAANLFSMAQQLQFTSLPTLFFNTHPKSSGDVVGEVEPKGYNRDVKTVLIRKLGQYIAWRDATFDELKNRRKFTLNYTVQHYQVIRMYIQWIKPYLKHIEKLTSSMTGLGRADIVSSFEGSMIELEFLAQKLFTKDNKQVFSCVLMSFEYRTKPELSFVKEGYHRGPIHVGQTTITWRSYAWTQKQIENYLKMREDADLELLGSIDNSLKDTMDALGDDLKKYLAEKNAEMREQREGVSEPKKPEVPSVWGPFADVGKGFKDLVNAFVPVSIGGGKGGVAGHSGEDAGLAKVGARLYAWQNYKLFKKAHGMLTW